MAARPDAHNINYSGAAGDRGGWDYLEFGMTAFKQTGWAAHRDQYAVPVLFNPYTGEPRDVRDVQSDPQGILIVPPGKVEMLAAQPEQEPGALTLDSAPLGTKAPAFGGGAWTKTESGWKWNSGSTFPRPGGDWTGRLILPTAQTDQWTGCGECDCAFSCHNGEARCIRLQPEPAKRQWNRGCGVCGIGADGQAMGYVCNRSDCPTRVTYGGVA